MGWLSSLGIIAKLGSKLFGYFTLKKAISADVMKDQLDDIHLANQVKKKLRATDAASKRNSLRKYKRK